MGKQIFNMTPEERREAGRRGGIASGEAKRKKKAMKETLECILSMSLASGKKVDVEDVQSFAKMKGANISVQDAVLVAMIQRAMKGSVDAAEFLRDTVGEKPSTDANLNLQGPVFIGGEEELEE